jgi:phosphate transport system permease protein
LNTLYFFCLVVFVAGGFLLGRSRAAAMGGRREVSLHSLPSYHGLFLAFAVLVPMAAIFAFGAVFVDRYAEWRAISAFDAGSGVDDLHRSAILRDLGLLASGRFTGEPSAVLQEAARRLTGIRTIGGWLVLVSGMVAATAALAWGYGRISPTFHARNRVENFVEIALFACSAVAVLTTVGIVLSVLFETVRFFQLESPFDFLFGLHWSPQTAIRADQIGSSGAFGIVPLVAGTFLITLIAMLVAGPLGLFSAIYMAEYATPKVRAAAKPFLEILAGIPTVVLGFFAALTVAPLIRNWGDALGMSVASESALAAGLVMGMMIIPFVSSLSDDVINAVPQSLRDGSYAMGATQAETIRKVVLPAALPGIVSAFLLGISRAVGETMIVVMAAGLAANLTLNPFQAVTTFTVQIKTILVGDQEFDSAKTLSAFALGFVLFLFTLTLNFIALRIVKRYREQYE